MSEAVQPAPQARRAPRASLGSPEGDDVFGTFDARVARRFFAYLGPHQRMFAVTQVAVLASAAASVAMPRLIGLVVTRAARHDVALLDRTLVEFGIGAVLFIAAFFCGEWLSSRLAQRVIFDIRRAMFAHFQDISLSFMDKTHVGRIMSRLQGDVNSLQEFLESSTGAVGDFATLIGISVMLVSMKGSTTPRS